ncbi:MAG: hypothetical protein ABI776_06380 [Nocardioidaceae bacterium]
MSSTHDSTAADGSGHGDGSGGEKAHRAGAFDMRNFIAALIGIYGVVLVIYGIIGSSAEQAAKADGVNINLYAGIGMVVVAGIFLTWARLRPVVVPADVHADDQDDPAAH